MSDGILSLVLLAVAVVGLPASYVATCRWLQKQQAWSFLYAAYFILFGTLGGWVFAVAMSPSGIAAASIVFLMTVALAACLISAVIVTFKKQKKRAEWIALTGGYAYPVCLGLLLTAGFMLDGASR